jgi:hypothetical protein
MSGAPRLPKIHRIRQALEHRTYWEIKAAITLCGSRNLEPLRVDGLYRAGRFHYR